MKGYPRKLPSCVGCSLSAAFLLGLAGASLCLFGPMLPVGAQDSRALQIWPDRSIGVTSGLFEGSTVHVSAQILPFGVHRTSAGKVVRAHTYLHFPLDVFPPGTEILRATLYVYVDGSSGTGEAAFGAYRVLDPWGEESWNSDPAAWPALLSSPIAVMAARFDVPTPALPVSAHTPTAASSPTLTPPTSPLPTPTFSPASTAPVVSLGQVAGAWLTWDVTVLMRAWLAEEVPDHGLALAPAPDADPETAGDLLVARWLATDDPNTRPYLIAELKVHPVTPTPTSTPTVTPVPVLPSAGSPVGWWAADKLHPAGLLLVGAALLTLGLAVRRR